MKITDGLKTFHELVRNQFIYGGTKYASTKTKESTDQLFDDFGKAWLFGTMAKYIKRFNNLERERDLLKIACYCYITWLKRGFFVKAEGLKEDNLYTTVDIKEANFQKFLDRMHYIFEMDNFAEIFENVSDEEKLSRMYNNFRAWANGTWGTITQTSLASVYYTCYLLWLKRYVNAKSHDEDVNNETK